MNRPFLGSFHNKLDSKGRVSVPASFRTVLRAGNDEAPAELILRRSHRHVCIEAWPIDAFYAFAAPLDQLPTFSEDEDDLTTALYADAYHVEADKDGRVILPESLVQYAQLTDAVAFMGLRRFFQIWEPAAAARRAEEARDRARVRGLTLPGQGQGQVH